MGFFDDAKEFFTSGNWGKPEAPLKAKSGLSKAANSGMAEKSVDNDIEVQRAKQDVTQAESSLTKAEERLATAEAASLEKQNARYDQELNAARKAYLTAEQRAKNFHLHIDYGAAKGSEKEQQQNNQALQLEQARDQAKAKYEAIQDKSAWWASNPPDAHVNPIYKEDVASAKEALARANQKLADATNAATARAGG
jgi:hypothetical protein